jgi:hypothetical protein
VVELPRASWSAAQKARPMTSRSVYDAIRSLTALRVSGGVGGQTLMPSSQGRRDVRRTPRSAARLHSSRASTAASCCSTAPA